MELTGAPGTVIHPCTFAVLRQLNKAPTEVQYTAGAAIASAIGVTRSDVREAVRQLRELGVQVDRQGGDDFRLARPYDALDASAVTRALGEAGAHYRVVTVDICGSTNAAILDNTHEENAAIRVLAAELQTAGRGRRGRAWVSGLGTSLTFSALWPFEQGVGALAGLSLAVGLAVARALDELGAKNVALKWPNDVLLAQNGSHAKLGGILIELSGDISGPTRAVIGIGLNVRLPPAAREGLMNATGQLAADLGDTGVMAARSRVLAAALRHLHATLKVFGAEGFGALRAAWSARHAYQGSEVAMIQDGKVENGGVVEGVDHNGALLLRTSHGVEAVVSGELSLRPRGD